VQQLLMTFVAVETGLSLHAPRAPVEDGRAILVPSRTRPMEEALCNMVMTRAMGPTCRRVLPIMATLVEHAIADSAAFFHKA
jgi:hypothetical protein